MQVFLQGKLLGIDSFLLDSPPQWRAFAGRALFASLLSETIPRALLKRLGMAPTLLGTSGGGQFLLLLTDASLPDANDFLVDATRRIQASTRGRMRLAWSSTEELGAWSDVRKRLDAGMVRWRGLSALEPEGVFEPFEAAQPAEDDPYAGLMDNLALAPSTVWDPESPLLLAPGGELLPLATHSAPSAELETPASPVELAARAAGRQTWGVLRGDVDRFYQRLAIAASIHDHIQCSVFYRQFLAGEIQVLCSQAEYWQKVSVLYTGGDDFAVFGSWDALIPFAREIQRLFHRSVDEFLRDFPGPEGKTISMALALAPAPDSTLGAVYSEAGRLLEVAKAEGRDRFCLFGRTIDWKELNEAADLRQTMVKLVEEFGCSPQFLGEMGGFYRETDKLLPSRLPKHRTERQNRPWRFHRRLSRLLEAPVRQKEFQKIRAGLMAEFLTRNQAQVKLKPAGRVALEWARLAQETETV